MKKECGLTLISLIITIIILLILAGISITLLLQTNLLQSAKKAKNITQNSQIEVNTTLSNYENIINNYINNSREEISSNTKLAGIFVGWKSASSWNSAGLTDYVQIDENLCVLNNYNVTIKENGHYLISMLAFNSEGTRK